MKRLTPLLILAFLVGLALVVALRTRLAPRPGATPAMQSPLPNPDSLPLAPDMDSIPGDSLFYGALQRHREELNRDFAGDESPLEESDRASFQGLRFFDPDPGFRFRIPLAPPPRREMVTLLDTKGQERSYERFGVLTFPVDGKLQNLTLFRDAGRGYLFLPFRDATNGQDTYDVGRYVEPIEEQPGTYLVDFNRAYNPYCAYSHRWACPIPPEENRLNVAIRAGERVFHEES